MPIIVRLGTPHFRKFLVENSPLKSIKDTKAFIDVFHNTSVEIYEAKKHAFQQGDEELATQIAQGKDIISILSNSFPFLQVKFRQNFVSERKHEGIWRRETIRCGALGPNQVSLCISRRHTWRLYSSLTFAATDTTSGALARALHLLAQHKDVQTKLRHEIRQARKDSGGEDIPYDTLVSLPYLDAICRETLRLWVGRHH